MGRPKSSKQIARVSVSFDSADYQALRNLAKLNDVSTAWLVRRAVAAFLKAHHCTNCNKQNARDIILDGSELR